MRTTLQNQRRRSKARRRATAGPGAQYWHHEYGDPRADSRVNTATVAAAVIDVWDTLAEKLGESRAAVVVDALWLMSRDHGSAAARLDAEALQKSVRELRFNSRMHPTPGNLESLALARWALAVRLGERVPRKWCPVIPGAEAGPGVAKHTGRKG